MRRSTSYYEDLCEVVGLRGHGTWAHGDLYETTQDLVEALSPLQAMSKGHEVRMATIVSALLRASQDRFSGVPERLQSLGSSVAARSLAWQNVHLLLQAWRNPVPLLKRGNARRLSSAASRHLHWRRCLNV